MSLYIYILYGMITIIIHITSSINKYIACLQIDHRKSQQHGVDKLGYSIN